MIEHSNLDDLLRKYFSIVSSRKVVICPFITIRTLDSILSAAASINVTIVTSWRPDHLRSGVSNIELFTLAQERGWTLFICDHLHLKLYSNGLSGAWIGSANITNKALSDQHNSNIEGLYKIKEITLVDRIFVESIISNSTRVTEQVYQLYSDWFEQIMVELPEDIDGPDLNSLTTDDDYLITKLPAVWSPTRLWELVTGTVEPDEEWGEGQAMVHDLALYDVSNQESEDQFMQRLTGAFFAHPFIKSFSNQIDEEGVQFGSAKEWLQSNCTTIPMPYRRELTETVQCLFNWFIELAPKKYELIQPNVSQILRLKVGFDDVICEYTSLELGKSWFVSGRGFPEEGVQYKSCPWCSRLHGRQLVFRVGRVYPINDLNRSQSEFGFTIQRRNSRNTDGIHSYCNSCRRDPKPTVLPTGGTTAEELESALGTLEISSRGS